MMIDCANFYRALHAAFSKAQRSIFIVGWAVDSNIRLLRGEDEKNSSLPSVVLDLISHLAKENPELQIYILCWDASVAFFSGRDLMSDYIWSAKTPENIHICMDDTIPIGGSHHQKIILVDDELVFTGGMDIARQRWDERDHKIDEPERNDTNGSYGPYHDVQIMVTGPVVQDFAELVRWRWQQAAEYEALPVRPFQSPAELPPSWPGHFKPDFQKMICAISRTIPPLDKKTEVQEVRHMYIDLIKKVQEFIYIENQFLTCKNIALALNEQLQLNPNLRVLLVSSFNPQGVFESEALWAGRIDFKNIIQADIEPGRVKMVCSGIDDHTGKTHYKRIHSKVFIVDDAYLNVASSNLNNRSMTLDTECDFIVAAESALQKERIARVRNDLIAEHTGRSIEQVQDLFARKARLEEILNTANKQGYSLREIDDTQFTHQNFKVAAQRFADPAEPLIPYFQDTNGRKKAFRNPGRSALIAGVLFLVIVIGGALALRDYTEVFKADKIQGFLEASRSSSWALITVCMVYVVGGFVLFPVTLLSLITAAVFGSLLGPLYGLCGALTSASVMFGLGRFAGMKGVRRLTGDRVKKIDHHFQKTGVVGVAVLRLIPIAPFSLVNLAAGISSVTFFDFLIGSLLGFLPAFVAKGFVGDSLTQIFLNPTPKTIMYLILGVLLWLGMVYVSYLLAKRWKKSHPS